ncbi:hypothetical protein GA0074692_4177 [Micromonospora pallida]|uniref:Excreted virulence factor EspC, type VII ESX diderm n=1 Tax=Micromonospora pallida TaxID=145854 RepID=A0A1C6T1X0_9ACTN|nr:hypothetical protein [Micromonospora pallida]SCL35768.1 hypothetical protein GA0074692_4177 [Micromonospora pallida]
MTSKHISSEAIEAIREHLRKNALSGPNGVDAIKAKLTDTEIGFPHFGVIGIPLAMAYGDVREKAATALNEIRETVDDYLDELDTAKKTWIKAENANTVVTT